MTKEEAEKFFIGMLDKIDQDIDNLEQERDKILDYIDALEGWSTDSWKKEVFDKFGIIEEKQNEIKIDG